MFMISVIAYLVAAPLVHRDLKNSDPAMYSELGAYFYLNPFRQLEFLWYIVTRKYAQKHTGFHRYDLFLFIIVVFAISFFAYAVSIDLSE